MKKLGIRIKTVLLATAASVALSASAVPMDFEWSFVNTVPFANAGNAGDVITGRILGLNEGLNFQKVTVTVDSIVPSVDPAFATGVPHSWFDYVTASVTAGNIDFAFFSSNDGDFAVRLNTAFFSLAGYNRSYSTSGSVTFKALTGRPVTAPDAGSTLLLLGMGFGVLAWLQRRAK